MINYMTQIEARMRWMYNDRRGSEFITNLHTFFNVANANLYTFFNVGNANKVDNFMPCPCIDCRNVAEYSSSRTLQGHLVRRGFIPGYYCWSKHGERGVRQEDNEEEEDDDSYP